MPVCSKLVEKISCIHTLLACVDKTQMLQQKYSLLCPSDDALTNGRFNIASFVVVIFFVIIQLFNH